MRLLFAVLVLGLSVPARAQFEYITNNGAITITGYEGTDRSLVIPDSINDMQVTGIANAAFENHTNLNYVVIPETVTHLGTSAFSGCSWLFGVTMPNGIQSIPDYAFYRCFQLVDITLPEDATNIGSYAFADCASLREVNIPDRVRTIDAWAFQSCWRLSTLTIGDGVTSIAVPAFSGFTNLGSVVIGNSLTNIWPWAFGNCRKLTNVVIGGGVTSIESEAFLGCTALGSITIPRAVTNIAMGYYGAFTSCSGLTEITVHPDNRTYSSVGGVLFDEARSALLIYPAAKRGDYTVPAGVINVGDSAFGGCNALTNVTIANTVTNIGKGAFSGCVNLSSISLGDGLINVGEGAFANCDALQTIIFPDGLRSVGPFAFHHCMRLETVIFGRNLTYIGQAAFSYCSSIREVFFLGNAPRSDPGSPFYDYLAFVYYMPGKIGWSGLAEGRGILWDPRMQAPRVGPDGFRCVISGNSNIVLVVEASTNPANPAWTPVSTNNLAGGSSQFHDPTSPNLPSRFYRLRSTWTRQ